MELWMGCNGKPRLGDRCESGLDVVERREARSAARRREESRPGCERPMESSDPARCEQRYERFEPITIRAAARVLQLQQAGIVSAWEAGFYLHELVDMDRHAGRGAYPSLLRLAQRHLGHRALTRIRAGEGPEEGRPFCLDHPACMGLELAGLA